jgi:hypothetical protein
MHEEAIKQATSLRQLAETRSRKGKTISISHHAKPSSIFCPFSEIKIIHHIAQNLQ